MTKQIERAMAIAGIKSVRNEEDLMAIAKIIGEKLDNKLLVDKYRAMRELERISKFRLENDCMSCEYFGAPRRCHETTMCPKNQNMLTILKTKECPKNPGGKCPYANDSGTCFGFCIKEIMQEKRNR